MAITATTTVGEKDEGASGVFEEWMLKMQLVVVVVVVGTLFEEVGGNNMRRIRRIDEE